MRHNETHIRIGGVPFWMKAEPPQKLQFNDAILPRKNHLWNTEILQNLISNVTCSEKYNRTSSWLSEFIRKSHMMDDILEVCWFGEPSLAPPRRVLLHLQFVCLFVLAGGHRTSPADCHQTYWKVQQERGGNNWIRWRWITWSLQRPLWINSRRWFHTHTHTQDTSYNGDTSSSSLTEKVFLRRTLAHVFPGMSHVEHMNIELWVRDSID